MDAAARAGTTSYHNAAAEISNVDLFVATIRSASSSIQGRPYLAALFSTNLTTIAIAECL
jgi:hypothetical protein